MKKKLGIAIAVIGLLVAAGYGWYRYTFPYGSKHCCLKGLGLALMNYAQNHHGCYPAGAGCPEASLSLLYRANGGTDAYILSGKTIPVEIAAEILERGELLGPDSCDWHYVEGLTSSDDSRLAIVWDKIGLGHDNQRLPQGGHSVMFLDCHEEVVPDSDWPQFLEFQESLMANRAERARTAKGSLPPGPLPAQEFKLRATLASVWTGTVAFSPDGKTLASGSLDSTVKLWDMATGTNTATLGGHRDEVWSVAFSPDGKTLASGSCDGMIKLWDAAAGKNTATLAVDRPVTSLAFSPDSKILASGNGRSPMLWDMTTGKNVATLKGHTGGVWSVAYGADGKTLASGDEDETIRLWDVATGNETTAFRVYPHLPVRSVVFSPDGKILASGSANTIRLWDVATGKTTYIPDGGSSIAFSPNGKTLASDCSDYTVKVWDVKTGKIIATLLGHAKEVKAVAFSPDGNTLASGSWDGTIKLWHVKMSKQVGNWEREMGHY